MAKRGAEHVDLPSDDSPSQKRVRRLEEGALEGLWDSLTCPICGDVFNCPVVLGCNHTFCYSCLISDLRSRPAVHRNGTIQCAQCRAVTDIRRRPLENRVNYALFDVCSARRKILGLPPPVPLTRKECLYDDDEYAQRMKRLTEVENALRRIIKERDRAEEEVNETKRQIREAKKEYKRMMAAGDVARTREKSLRTAKNWQEWILGNDDITRHRFTNIEKLIISKRGKYTWRDPVHLWTEGDVWVISFSLLSPKDPVACRAHERAWELLSPLDARDIGRPAPREVVRRMKNAKSVKKFLKQLLSEEGYGVSSIVVSNVQSHAATQTDERDIETGPTALIGLAKGPVE